MRKNSETSAEDLAGTQSAPAPPKCPAPRPRRGSASSVLRTALRVLVWFAIFLELIYITSIPSVQQVLFGDAQVNFYKKNHDFLLSKANELYDYVMGHYSRYVHYALWGISAFLGLGVFYVCYGRRSPCVRRVVKSVEAVGKFFSWLWIHL